MPRPVPECCVGCSKYLGYYVIILASEEITNDHGIWVVRVAAHDDPVQEWEFDDGAADALNVL